MDKTTRMITAFCLALLITGGATMQARGEKNPAPVRETATLGGGCFWCVEAVYEELAGVETAISGYAGGDDSAGRPTYRDVCGGETGHAEVVQLTYDPAVIGFREILEVFFSVHDPSTLNRQGADVGSQYRSIILYHDDRQRREAEDAIAELERRGDFADPVVTEIAPLTTFFPAERDHQDYFRRNPQSGYCRMVIAPKMEKFRRGFTDRLER